MNHGFYQMSPYIRSVFRPSLLWPERMRPMPYDIWLVTYAD
jgi:uncharacterized protein YukJ